MRLYQHNHVGKIKETVKVTFENGYSIILEAGVETSMSLTMCESAKNTEQLLQPHMMRPLSI